MKCECVSVQPQDQRRNEEREDDMRRSLMFSRWAGGHELICSLLLTRAISAVSCLCLTSAGSLARPPAHSAFIWDCGDRGPSDMYSSMHPEVRRGSPPHISPSWGRVLALEGWMREVGRKGWIFLFCFC